MTIYTTLNKIRACSPCTSGWRKLLAHLGKSEADDEPLAFATILESNGLDDALWTMRSAPEHDREWRSFAVWCARRVQPLMADPRSIHAIDVAERFANGEATDEELTSARKAAWAAAARVAAKAEAWAEAWAARAAAWAAAEAAEAAKAVWAAAWAAEAEAAWAAAEAAKAAERDAQTAQFLLIVS